MAGVRVVLVDDLPDMRRLLSLWLEDSHVTVVGEASDCDEAVEGVERERPDLVVMDIHMPGRTGVECTREFVSRHPGIAVVGFLSADEQGGREEMVEAGAVASLHNLPLTEVVAVGRGL